MVELIRDGKYDAGGKRAAPLRLKLPFQTVETVNESAQQRQLALDLFSTGRPAAWRAAAAGVVLGCRKELVDMATILTVEDEGSVQELLKAILMPQHQVVSAADVTQAIELARFIPPDLVLLDLNLQGHHDGLDVCRALRSEPDPALAQVPIIMLTGLAGQEDIAAALAAGADGYVRKPYSPSALRSLVDNYLTKEDE
jgi:CheY-like chemotaxis protein